MKIIKEGRIMVQPGGHVYVTGFELECEDGETIEGLYQLAQARILAAARRITEEGSRAEIQGNTFIGFPTGMSIP